jgi:hypothetical protein
MKTPKGVFTEIIENSNKKSSYDYFTENLPYDSFWEVKPDGLNKVQKKALVLHTDTLDHYKSEIKQNIKLFIDLAEYEMKIMQLINILNPVIKLTLVKQQRGDMEVQYVVARAPFFNPKIKKQEIRVYLGKTDDLSSNIVKLSKDQDFMRNAKNQIIEAMFNVMVSDENRIAYQFKKT